LPEDCVEWDELPPRVARGEADLLVVQTDNNAEANWAALTEARQLTSAPTIAVGPKAADAIQKAQRSGVVEYVDSQALPESLDSALAHMQSGGAIRPQRGAVIAVVAPMPGSGRTTVALNLAGALARKFPDEAVLVEVAAEGSPLADWLGLEPEHPANEVFNRHQRLDAGSLKAAFARHESGLRLIVNSPELGNNPQLDPAAIKRLCVLSRVAARFTILSVADPESEAGAAAMRAADTVLLVTRGDVPSVKRARRLIVALPDLGVSASRVRLVLNRDGQPGQLSTAQIESGLGQAVNYQVPDDPSRVNRAMNYGELLVASWGSRIARRFRTLAGDLAGTPEKVGGWFGS
jgi:pilus assembly protein CpaE